MPTNSSARRWQMPRRGRVRVVVCALNYNTDPPYSTHAGGPTQGWISRYAWSQRDYHDVVLEKLRTVEAQLLQLYREQGGSTPTHAKTANERGTQARTWCYVDTGPVIERVFAKYAGIGWIGKNTCVLNEELGVVALSRRHAHLAGADARPAAGRPLRLMHSLP